MPPNIYGGIMEIISHIDHDMISKELLTAFNLKCRNTHYQKQCKYIVDGGAWWHSGVVGRG